MKKYLILTLAVFTLILGSLLVFSGCADYEGEIDANQQPTILTFPDADSIVVSSAPVVYWRGFDRDGEVYSFEHIDIVRGDIPDADYYSYFDNPLIIPDEINGDRRTYSWERTKNNNDTLFLSLLQGADTTEHLVCVRGIDSDSVFSDPVCRVWYRTNKPPDSLYVTDEWFKDELMDTVWCLKGPAYSWNGIDLNWFGHDPDNSVILEYKWAFINVNDPSDTAKWSLVDDRGDWDEDEEEWTGIPESGEDKFDGWVRGKDFTRLFDIPTGTYYFRLHIRDDAFYEGTPFEREIRIVKPEFDPTDTAIVMSIYEDTYEHRVLIVDETYDGTFTPYRTPSDASISHDFYTGVMEDLDLPYSLIDISSEPFGMADWALSRDTLSRYSVIYWFDAEGGNSQKISADYPEIIKRLKDYIAIGGNVIFDGRNCFVDEIIAGGDTSLATAYFGIEAYHEGSFKMAEGVATSYYDYPDISVNYEMIADAGIDTSNIQYISALEQASSTPMGLPFTEPIYFYVDKNGDESPAHMKPAALRYTTSAFKTAYFSFPLYFMDNSDGSVSEALEMTIDFVTHREPLTADDDSTDSFLF